jgi:hypothetical protein
MVLGTRGLPALLVLCLTAAACVGGSPGDDRGARPVTPPASILGAFEDDYGNRFTITAETWALHDSARYHVEAWHPDQRFVVLRNDEGNPSEPGLWTRIDWVELADADPWQWAFCMSVYDAPTPAAAAAFTQTDSTTPRTGCNGYPFSRMKSV